jgi:hypothetical protein
MYAVFGPTTYQHPRYYYTVFIFTPVLKYELLMWSECLRTSEFFLWTIRIDLHGSAAVSIALERKVGTKRYGVKRDALRIQQVQSGAKLYPDYSGSSRVFRHVSPHHHAKYMH